MKLILRENIHTRGYSMQQQKRNSLVKFSRFYIIHMREEEREREYCKNEPNTVKREKERERERELVHARAISSSLSFYRYYPIFSARGFFDVFFLFLLLLLLSSFIFFALCPSLSASTTHTTLYKYTIPMCIYTHTHTSLYIVSFIFSSPPIIYLCQRERERERISDRTVNKARVNF